MWAKNKKKMGEKVKLEQNEAGKPNKKNETIKKRSTFLEFSEKRFDGGNNTVLLSRLWKEKAMPNQRDPKRTTTGLSINKETLEFLRKIAKEKGTNVSNLIEKLISTNLAKKENSNQKEH